MSLIMVAVLIIGGLVGAVVVSLAIPVLIGLAAWDLYESRDGVPVRGDAEQRISLERGFARAFVIAGGLFWTVATFAGMFTFRETGVAYAMLEAFIPLMATLVTLVVGWYYERATAALLAIASFAVVVWGVIYGFELGVWIIVTLALIGPMMTAAVLFWLARRDQEAYELSLANSPQLAPVSEQTGF